MVSEILRLAALDAAAAPILVAVAPLSAASDPEGELGAMSTGLAVGHANAAFTALYGLTHPLTAGAEWRLFSAEAVEANARARRAVIERRAAIVIGVARRQDGAEFRLEARIAPLTAAPGVDSGGLSEAASVVTLRPLSAPTGRPLQADLAIAALDAAAEELTFTDDALSTVMAAFPGLVVILDGEGDIRATGGAGLQDIGDVGAADAATLEELLGAAGALALAPYAADAAMGARTRFDFEVAGLVFEAVAAPIGMDAGRTLAVALMLHDVTDERLALDLAAGPSPFKAPRSEY